MHVSEIHVKRIRVNQGLGVYIHWQGYFESGLLIVKKYDDVYCQSLHLKYFFSTPEGISLHFGQFKKVCFNSSSP